MPATSKAQFRFMQAAAHGGVKDADIKPEQAKEFVAGQSPKGLPERAPKRKKPITLAERVKAQKKK